MNYSTLACILAYYPEDGFNNICTIIAQQVDFLLIVDNSPDDSLANSGYQFPTNSSIYFNRNIGTVAGALNVAIKKARDEKFDFLQIFDQDTQPILGITKRLIDSLLKYPNIGIISPRFVNLNTGYPGRVLIDRGRWCPQNTWPNSDIGIVDVLFTINSASLLNIKLIPQDIYYDERLVIDGCDIDFCLALKRLEFKIKIDTGLFIPHGIGNRNNQSGRWSPTNYSIERKELMSKNRIIVWRRYLKYYPGFIINDFLVFILDSGRSIFMEKRGFRKMFAIIKGMVKGLLEKNIQRRSFKTNNII
ncbi:hypothetical protein [Mucilaginibacter dorajii]|uniref:Glycosyltransferase family 2 protein n=1 Tax=Mucilaginibacter dorajii TaxID=692994 RepID=A0ABP7RAH0_9SPHI|nr:hypothetical protein [Mucilaginibacter dorajii]MCS3736705.1 rhamnosyltransferase [Mucilaginibacter dorajii]